MKQVHKIVHELIWAVEKRAWGTLGTFEPMPEGGGKWRLTQVWQSICGRWNSKCKGPETHLTWLRGHKRASVPGAE